MEDEYEIMPHRTIENIKKELDELKKKAASTESISDKSFKKSLDNLTSSINNLMFLFKEASKEMQADEEREKGSISDMGKVEKKLEELEGENKKIASGILAVADMLTEESKNEPEKEIIKRTWKEKVIPKPIMIQQRPMQRPTQPPQPIIKETSSIETHEFHPRPPQPTPPKDLFPKETPIMPPSERFDQNVFNTPIGPTPEKPMPFGQEPRLSPVPPPTPMGMPGLPEPPAPMPEFSNSPNLEKKKGFFSRLFKK